MGPYCQPMLDNTIFRLKQLSKLKYLMSGNDFCIQHDFISLTYFWPYLRRVYFLQRYNTVIILCLLAQNKAHLYKTHALNDRTSNNNLLFFLTAISFHCIISTISAVVLYSKRNLPFAKETFLSQKEVFFYEMKFLYYLDIVYFVYCDLFVIKII